MRRRNFAIIRIPVLALLLGTFISGHTMSANAGDSASVGGGADAVTTGGYHSCALVSGGVSCWGANSFGQLGDGGSTDSLVAVSVSSLTSGSAAISGGQWHTCA